MRGLRNTAAMLAVCLALVVCCPPAQAASTRAQAAQQAVETAAQYGGAVSVQYALWEDGAITLSGHTGVYSRTEAQEVTADTLYGVGSVSKIYTTAAVMKLVEEGEVALDEPVTTYLPDFHMEDGRYQDITVRMLLNHSSGLMGSSFSSTFLLNDPVETCGKDELLQRLSTQRLKADPGAYSVYCNDGFTLAELVVERMSGMDLTAFVRQNLLTPAGLSQTFTPADPFDRAWLAKTYLGTDTRALPPENVGAIGAGGFYASAGDLAAFGGSLYTADLLSPDSLEAMAADEGSRGLWPDSTGGDLLAYGLGWDSVRMYPFYEHGIQALVKGGDTQLYHAGLIVLPEYQMAVAVLSSGGSSIYNELAGARILMDALAERGVSIEDKGELPAAQPAAMPAALADYAGLYGSSTGIATISLAEDTLSLQLPQVMGGACTTYRYYSDGSFRDENGILLRFVTERNGRVYLLQQVISQVPGLVSAPSVSYAFERLPENPISQETQAAWAARDGKVYLLLNEKYTSQLYPLGGVFAGMQTIPEAPGYLLSNQITGENEARSYVQIPGTAGRDGRDMVFLQQDGLEYFFYGDYLYMDADGAKPLYTGPGAYSTIQTDGYARWYQTGRAAGQTLTVTIEGAGGFCVYDTDGKLTAASWAYGETGTVLPEGGWIVFAGDPGTRFHITTA